MIILPAIDIKDGNCVRLLKGDFGTVEKVAENPLETARSFEACGARWIHMVDLDGAKDAVPRNRDIFVEVAAHTGLQVEVGGGIRNLDTVENYLSAGITRVILGPVAVKDPALVKTALQEFGPERIVVGIDAKNGMVSVEGWLDSSTVHYLDLAREMERVGVRTIIFTDISRDGTLEGPSIHQLKPLKQAVGCDLIASGGIACLKDITALKKLGMYGAICGKSLYKGTLDLKEAIEEAEDHAG